jgi:hypothetical protein
MTTSTSRARRFVTAPLSGAGDKRLSPRALQEGSSVKQRSARPHVNFAIERESTFFISRDALLRSIELASLPVSEIIQHYFPEQAVEFVKRYALMLVARHGNHDMHCKITETKFKSARLRRTKSSGAVGYSLDLKGAKCGADRSRVELSIKIEVSTYCELIDHANDGALRKVRHHLRGLLHSKDGKAVKAEAEIDFIVGAGLPRGRERSPPSLVAPANFALVDIEFPTEAHAELTKGHFHTFSFLALHGVDVTHAPRSLRKPLSARYMARNGISKHTRLAAKRLRKLSLQSSLSNAASNVPQAPMKPPKESLKK